VARIVFIRLLASRLTSEETLPMPTTVTYADGGLCVVDPQVFRGERTRLVSTLLEQLTQRDDIAAVACDLTSGRCQIRWADAATPVSSAAARFVEALQAGCAAEAAEPAWRRLLWSRAKRQTSPGERTQLSGSSSAAASAATGTMLVRGPKRLLYLAAGAGSSVMTVVGVLVPGIPTVPFLLSSSYFLARSSPRAHAALLSTPLFGTLVREWDAHQALSGDSKKKLIAFTLVIIGTTVVIAKANPFALGMMAIVAPACIYSIVRLPGIESDASSRRELHKAHAILS
jgi:uncharacterized membrane protein YbaN (DUF454 family)